MIGTIFRQALQPKITKHKNPKIPVCVVLVMVILAISFLGIPWFVFDALLNSTMHTLVEKCMELNDKISFVALVNAQIPIFYFVVERQPCRNLNQNCMILLRNLMVDGRQLERKLRFYMKCKCSHNLTHV